MVFGAFMQCAAPKTVLFLAVALGAKTPHELALAPYKNLCHYVTFLEDAREDEFLLPHIAEFDV